jgi:hypothetical protein
LLVLKFIRSSAGVVAVHVRLVGIDILGVGIDLDGLQQQLG